MTNVVISQSMLFPWVGMLEQMLLADVFIHYDDVQFSKGSFTNRVQLKTESGSLWMTVPLMDHKFGQAINEVRVQPSEKWISKHLDSLELSFAGAPYASEAINLASEVYSKEYQDIGSLSRHSMLSLADYYGLLEHTDLIDAASLNIDGSGSERVLEIVKAVNGSCYISGHGAINYLHHDLFEQAGIEVAYMDYKRIKYTQNYGEFNPYVSGLDLVANCGLEGLSRICSKAVYWKDFFHKNSINSNR